jgi:hypothetical protein
MISPRAAVAATILGLLIGCSKSTPRQISGQVFVVTRGKASVKMALVEVRLYEARVMEEHFKKRAPGVTASIEEAEPLAKTAAGLALEGEAKEESARLAMEAATGLMFKVQLAYFKLAKAEAQEARDVSDLAQAVVRVYRSAFPYFADLPQPAIATAKTDADGNFSISAAPGANKLALVATTSRAIGSGEEGYFWAVRLPDNGNEKISLTNDNECSSGSATSLLHTLDLDAAAMKAVTLSTTELQARMGKVFQYSKQFSASPSPTAAPYSGPAPPPLPEFSPLPKEEFVRLTVATTLRDAKGKEVKTLDPGKRLRVAGRSETEVTVYFWNEKYVVPTASTEPER